MLQVFFDYVRRGIRHAIVGGVQDALTDLDSFAQSHSLTELTLLPAPAQEVAALEAPARKKRSNG